MAHLKANLVLYQSANMRGRWRGGGGTHKVYGENVHRALKLNNFADIGATDFIFASFNS